VKLPPRGGLQVQAVENLAKFGDQQLRQHPSLRGLNLGCPEALLLGRTMESVQQNRFACAPEAQ